MNAQEIRDLFQRHNLSLSRDDVWEIQGNPVIHHKAVERLGVAIGIEWMPPQILRAEKDEAVMIVSGRVGERMEWSIGEAAIGQNYRVSGKQAAYVYCMSEKRGRDRVILKLAGLHGAYSEEEADDFKQQAKREPEPGDIIVSEPNKDREDYVKSFIARIGALSKGQALEYAKTERRDVWPEYGIDANDEDGQRMVKAYKDHVGTASAASGAEV